MNTIRLTVTPDLKKALDYLRAVEYPTLTDAEILKVAVGTKVADSKKLTGKKAGYDVSDPSLEELMYNAAKSFEMEDGGIEEEPFWDESKLKPLKLKSHV